MSVYGHGGWLKLAGTGILVREGGRLSMPRTIDPAYPISAHHYGIRNYTEGFRLPVVTVPVIPCAEWFTPGNLITWLITRSASPEFDLGTFGDVTGVEFSDSALVSDAGTALGALRVFGAKVSAFTLTASKQSAQVGCQLRIMGCDAKHHGETYGGAPVVITPPAVGLTGTILKGPRVMLGDDLAGCGIVSVSLTLDTGATPNMEMDGTERPKEINCDVPTATCTIQMYAGPGLKPPGWDVSGAYTEVVGSIWVNRGTIAVPIWTKFTMNKMVLQNPDDRDQQRGRVTRSFTYFCYSTDTQYPVEIS